MMDLDAMVARATEAKARADVATPGRMVAVLPRSQDGATVGCTGPSWSSGVEGFPCATSIRALDVKADVTGHAPGGWKQAERDARFFASARADVPTLADDVLALAAEVRRLQKKSEHRDQTVSGPLTLRGQR